MNTITVTCEDGEVRHEPFRTLTEASNWAHWGHCCTNTHLYTVNITTAQSCGRVGTKR